MEDKEVALMEDKEVDSIEEEGEALEVVVAITTEVVTTMVVGTMMEATTKIMDMINLEDMIKIISRVVVIIKDMITNNMDSSHIIKEGIQILTKAMVIITNKAIKEINKAATAMHLTRGKLVHLILLVRFTL